MRLLQNRLAVDGYGECVFSRGGGKQQIFAGFVSFESRGVADAARRGLFDVPWRRFPIGNVALVRGVGCAGEIVAGVGFDLHPALPVCVAEDVVLHGEATGVEHMHFGSNQIGDSGDDRNRLEGLGL